jgi:tetratricopeptide (TPR) repeat protein
MKKNNFVVKIYILIILNTFYSCTSNTTSVDGSAKTTVLKVTALNKTHSYADSSSINKNYHEAVIKLDKAILVDSNNSEIYYQKGKCLAKLGHYKESIWNFNKAIELNSPNTADAYSYMGCNLVDLHDPVTASILFTQAIKFNPNDKAYYKNRGICKQQMCRPPKEICEDFSMAIKLGSKDSALISFVKNNCNK